METAMTNHDPSDPLALGVAVFSRWRVSFSHVCA